jgi:TolB-like protein
VRIRPLVVPMLVIGLLAPMVQADEDPGAPRVVILPIVVHSALRDSEFVSQGIAAMLSARLEQQGKVTVVRVEDASAATTRVPAAIEAGRASGGDYVVFGEFTQFGDGASLDVQCVPVDSPEEVDAIDARRVFIQSGAMGEIIPKLDVLVSKLALYLESQSSGEGVAVEAPVPAAAPETSGAFAAESPPPGEVDDLRERVEALERAVYEAPFEDASASTTGEIVAEGAPES